MTLMFSAALMPDMRWIHGLAAAAFLLAAHPGMPLLAQGLDDPNTIDAIVGSQVQEEAVAAEAEPERVLAAIENTSEMIGKVRKVTTLDTVHIIFLPDASALEGGPPAQIKAKLEEHRDEIQRLRDALEGSAMLYHAIDSRGVLVNDVLAVEFQDNTAIIYAAAKPQN